MRFLAPCLVGALALLAGCASPPVVAVDGYASPGAKRGGAYVLLPADPRVPEGDLRQQAHAQLVEAALASAGWTRVRDRASADLLLRMRAGVSEPLTELREFDSPEFGVTGQHLMQTRETDASGRTTLRTQVTPTYGQTGYTRRTAVHVSYALSLQLDAYDLRRPGPDGEPPQVWKIRLAMRDAKGDLRSALPLMMKAAGPYLATDTGGVREVEVAK